MTTSIGKAPPSGANLLEEGHAQKLADKIKAKWRERGFAIETKVVPGQGFVGAWRCVPYFVRSNLVDGLPPPSARITEGTPE